MVGEGVASFDGYVFVTPEYNHGGASAGVSEAEKKIVKAREHA
jgi:NAD(P)H-dependent FMN reductase